MLCHTGLVWRAEVDGRRLHFRLAGLNNQNFIMEDEETGTWWQQVTGEAIHGPLKGSRLQPMPFETIGLGIWRAEHPNTMVLSPEASRLGDYAAEDWVERVREAIPVPEALQAGGELGARDLVVGIRVGDRSKAYPLDLLRAQTPITDAVGGVGVLLAVAADGKSVRAFDRTLDDQMLELYALPGADPPSFLDAESGSVFDFRGVATSGSHEGRELRRISVLTEFWFDWKNYHPQTAVYRGGVIPGR